MENYRQEFTNSSVWTVNHNLNTTTPVVDAWVTINGVSEKILALDYRIVNANTILVVFSSNYTGAVRIASPASSSAEVSYPPGYTGDGVYLPIEHFTPPPNLPPTAAIDTPANDVTITAGQFVNFTGTGSDPELQPLTYLWDFDGGATNTTQQDPGNVTFDTPGTYTVTFTVSDGTNSVSATRTVTVNAAAGVSFSVSHVSANSFMVQNTGAVSMKIVEVTTNPTSLITFPSGMLRGSVNSNFSSPFDDWYSAPATMSVVVPASGTYYFQLTYGWNTGDTATVTCTKLDDTGSTQQVLTK